MPKLTLSADRQVIGRAKELAEERGTSVSAMFAGFIRALDAPATAGSATSRDEEMAPITASVRGIARPHPTKSDRELYVGAIMEKYGA